MKTRKAVYAASLDPITNGHINVIERMAPLYNELVVLVAVDSRKAYTFSPEERADMTKAAVAHLSNVSVDVCLGHYVAKHADAIGASVIVRGIRNIEDLKDEHALAEENRKICSRIETVWVPCLPHLMFVSSSMVRNHVGVDPGWEKEVARSVPAAVVAKLKEKYILGKARKHWATLMLALGNPKGSDKIFNDLVARYSEPHRGYHILEHIVNMLDEFEPVASLATLPNEVRFAIWFHDSIYDTKTKDHAKIADNEARSGLLAEKSADELGLPGPDPMADRVGFGRCVSYLIGETTHTEMPSPNDPDISILLDLDLAILGKSDEEFDAYEVGIRKEYDWVPLNVFAKKRAGILRTFLKRSSIYSTPFFKEKYEVKARKNLKRSIAKLRSL